MDSSLIEDDVPLKELFDGCICCTIQDKLEVQLHELVRKMNWMLFILKQREQHIL